MTRLNRWWLSSLYTFEDALFSVERHVFKWRRAAEKRVCWEQV
jgi:hypothetical protein